MNERQYLELLMRLESLATGEQKKELQEKIRSLSIDGTKSIFPWM